MTHPMLGRSLIALGGATLAAATFLPWGSLTMGADSQTFRGTDDVKGVAIGIGGAVAIALPFLPIPRRFGDALAGACFAVALLVAGYLLSAFNDTDVFLQIFGFEARPEYGLAVLAAGGAIGLVGVWFHASAPPPEPS